MSNWPLVRLGDVTTKIGSGATPRGGKEVYQDSGVSFIRSQNVYDGRFSFVGLAHISDDAAHDLRGVAVEPRDVLVNITGESVTRTARVPDDALPARVSQHVAIVRPDSERLDSGFLLAALVDPPTKARLNAISTAGATRRALTKGHLEDTVIGLPPLDEQRRIAGVLGALNDLIETNRQLRTDALDLARETYKRAVEASDVEVSLRDCGRWLSGGTPSTSNPTYWGGDIPWISASSLHSFFLTSSDRQVTVEGAANGTRLVPAGSILFVVRGMSLKSEFRVGVAQREVAFGQDCKAIIVNERLPKATIAVGLLAASDSVLDMVDEASHGTGRLQSDRIEALPIRLPAERQLAVVEDALAALLAAGAAAVDEIADLTRARDELLPLLMSGRVRVREVA